MNATTNSYDELPYTNLSHPWTHPARIAAVATMFGLQPPPADRCRVLELGCAAGANLIPLAEILPHSEFVGVDGSARQIAEGVDAVRAAGLTNIRLDAADILAIDESWGAFDYIIAHGVFSWVPAVVRVKILEICRRNLKPRGIAHISYNTYPGWRLRGIVRDLMLQSQAPGASALERVAKARASLTQLAEMATREPWATFIRNEKKLVDGSLDSYVFHDHLERDNTPVYFREFMQQAGEHNLAYLGDADIKQMCAHNFGPVVTPGSYRPAIDQIEAEQLADFVVCRNFRSTLLVHAANAPRWSIEADAIHGLHVASTGRRNNPAAPVTSTGEPVAYVSPSGNVLETYNPILQAAMAVLGKSGPATIPFQELSDEVGAMVARSGPPGPADEIRRELAQGLIRTYVLADLTELYATPIDLPPVIGPRPLALKAARLALAFAPAPVPNLRHDRVLLEPEFDRRLLALLDGTRERADLIAEMSAATGQAEATIGADVDRVLSDFQAKALLVA